MIIILRLSISTDSPEIEEVLETDAPRAHGDLRAGARDTDALSVPGTYYVQFFLILHVLT